MEEKTDKKCLNSSDSTLDLHIIECPICLSTLIKPISLLCGHKY